MTLVVLGGGKFKKMLAGYITAPWGRKPFIVFDFRVVRM